jgi:chromosome condensin MukBEF MukE localization factor
MDATKEEMRDTVYTNLYQLYSRYALECFPYLTPQLTNLISYSAYSELIQMIQGGYIKDYYERIKKNAV